MQFALLSLSFMIWVEFWGDVVLLLLRTGAAIVLSMVLAAMAMLGSFMLKTFVLAVEEMVRINYPLS